MATAQTEKKTNGKKETPKTGEVQKYEGPMSERFTSAVLKEFGSTAGLVELTPFQRRLAQHLFIKIDTALQEFEKKREETDKAGVPIIWQNLNMTKLALSAMDRIELGLDALIPNHIWPIPYFNKRLGKYDLDLRVGYVGKDYYTRKMAIEEPTDIRYELVYSTDKFEVIKRSKDNLVETYQFEITKPFDRGEIVGGFGYISYENQNRNELIIVTEKDFQRSRKKAKSDTFWQDYPTEMKMKTLVHRVTSHLKIDPEKVNAAYLHVESDEEDAARVQVEIESKANKGDVIDMATGEVLNETTSKASDPGHAGQGEDKKEETREEVKQGVEDLPPLEAKKDSSGKGQAARMPGF